MIERTLALIKPDALYAGWSEEIKRHYRDAGLHILCERTARMSLEDAQEFYSEHHGKFFFCGLVLFMSSGPLVSLIIEDDNAVELVREINGATNPAEAKPGTIRSKFRSGGGPCNTVHGSADPKAARREIELSKRWASAEPLTYLK